MDSDSYYVMILDSCGKVVWKYGCDMVMCAKNEKDIAELSGTLRIYRTGKRVYNTEWDWRVFGDICKKDDNYYRYAHVGPMTSTVTTPQGSGDDPKLIMFPDIGEGPTLSHDITFEEKDGSPCDTGECDCYMGPIYSVSVGGLEFEETRSPDPAEAWRLFLPILERNPGFAEKMVRLVQVAE